MGGNQSSNYNYVTTTENFSLVNNFLTNNLVTTVTNSNNAITILIQIQDADGCPVNSTATINSSVTVNTVSNNQSVSSLANSLSTTLQNTADQNASLINGMGALQAGDNTNNVTTVKNSIQSVVNNTVTMNNINNVITQSINTTSQTITMFRCKNSPLNIDANIYSNVIAQNILTTLSNNLMQNSVIASVVNQSSQTASQHNQGINDVVDSVGKAISSIIGSVTGPYAISIVAIVLLLCICCSGLLAFGMSPAGQKASSQAVNAGAAYYAAKH